MPLWRIPRIRLPSSEKIHRSTTWPWWKQCDIIYCAGNEKVFSFLQDVFDEVMEIFPSKYVHIGGDEAWKTHWKKCPLCQARIRNESWPMKKPTRLLHEQNKQISPKQRKRSHGMDELTNSVVPDDVIVFGWQGFGNAALKAAEKGHRFVMTPAKVLYLIRYQAHSGLSH